MFVGGVEGRSWGEMGVSLGSRNHVREGQEKRVGCQSRELGTREK